MMRSSTVTAALVAAFLSSSCFVTRALDRLPENSDQALVHPEPGDPSVLARRELNVGIVVVNGVYNTELTAPLDVFHHTVFHVEPGMKVFTVAPTREAVRTFEGIRLVPDHAFADAPRIDVLVVPSAEHSMDTDLEDARLIEFVRERGAGADYVLSLCDGAFVLARAGLLEGLRATTFPADRERLAESFPGVTVDSSVRLVHDRKAITSVGGAPSFEPALYLCERLYGRDVARGIAKGLVIDWNLDDVPALTPPR